MPTEDAEQPSRNSSNFLILDKPFERVCFEFGLQATQGIVTNPSSSMQKPTVIVVNLTIVSCSPMRRAERWIDLLILCSGKVQFISGENRPLQAAQTSELEAREVGTGSIPACLTTQSPVRRIPTEFPKNLAVTAPHFAIVRLETGAEKLR